jgi:hypothetical protein
MLNAEERGYFPLPPQLSHPDRSFTFFRYVPRSSGGGPLGPYFALAFRPPWFSSTIPFRIRIYAKRPPKPRRIRSFKTQGLKPFRIRSFKKRGVGG